MTLINSNSPAQGFGIGLRPAHYAQIVADKPAVDWFEIISEDFLVEGGQHRDYLEAVRQDYPIAMHGVSMSIGSSDPLNWHYLKQLKALIERVNPFFVSDHLCWTGVNQINTHDLLPLPYWSSAIDYVAERIQQVQDYLGRRILIENISTYVAFKDSEMPEWEFLAAVANKADCWILLDINNIYVNAFNHGFNTTDYLHGIPAARVKQFHLAGHKNCQSHIIDTHDAPIVDPVWQLYANALTHFGPVATLIERDSQIPPLGELLAELKQAKSIFTNTLAEATA